MENIWKMLSKYLTYRYWVGCQFSWLGVLADLSSELYKSLSLSFVVFGDEQDVVSCIFTNNVTDRQSFNPSYRISAVLVCINFHLPDQVPSYHLMVTFFSSTSSTCPSWGLSWYFIQWRATISPSWYSYIIIYKVTNFHVKKRYMLH